MYKPRGTDIALSILLKSTNFLIYYDTDIDGLCAGDLVRRLLTAYKKPFIYYINQDRGHGFKLSEKSLSNLKGYTIIMVDALLTKEETKLIVDSGVSIINIDHHHMHTDDLIHVKSSITGCEGVVINNQYPFEPEEYRFLSGAGMVYYVIENWFKGFCSNDEMVLVGLSLLSDVRPLENEIASKFLKVTYSHKSPFTDYLIDIVSTGMDFGFGVKTFDRNFIDYTFAPKINALFRLNKGDTAIKLIQGNFYEDKMNLDVYRNIQNDIVDKIIQNSDGETLDNLAYMYVDIDIDTGYSYNISNFVGLACSRIKDREGKTTIVFVKRGNDIIRGSLRGLCDNIDYLNLLRKHGFTCEGHLGAFGIIACDLDKVDWGKLDSEIAELESTYMQHKYDGRLIPSSNLAFFMKSKHSKIADLNNFVRDSKRFYVRYTGEESCIKKTIRGKAIEYDIDGIPVLCFDEELSPMTDLILPLKERGKYISFYLKRF